MKIPDMTETEIWAVQNTANERWKNQDPVDLQVVDVEVRINPEDRELVECPAIFWEKDDCHFVIIKTDESRYRCQFFYRNNDQFGTGIPEYDNISECATSLLQVQADELAMRRDAQ